MSPRPRDIGHPTPVRGAGSGSLAWPARVWLERALQGEQDDVGDVTRLLDPQERSRLTRHRRRQLARRTRRLLDRQIERELGTSLARRCRRRLAAACLVTLLTVASLAPAPARALVEIADNVDFVILVSADEDVLIDCIDGGVRTTVDGVPTFHLTPCLELSTLSVTADADPGDHNTLDASGMSAADFQSLIGVTLNGGGGDDTLRGWEGPGPIPGLGNSLLGGEGADLVMGGGEADTLDGGPGADTLMGGAGADTLLGGLDPDTLVGEADGDSLVGGDGNDTILWNLGDGSDTMDGGNGDDLVTLLAGGGDDTIEAAGFLNGLEITGVPGEFLELTGVEWLAVDGGDGADTILANNFPDIPDLDGATLNGGAGADLIVTSAATLRQDFAATIVGSLGNDTLVGSPGRDLLIGGLDDDTMDGGGGVDMLLGEAGRDLLLWDDGNGDATLHGGPGEDRVQIRGSDTGDDLTLLPDIDRILLIANNVQPLTVDLVDAEALTLNGGAGDDTIDASLLQPLPPPPSGARGSTPGPPTIAKLTLDGGTDDDSIVGSGYDDTLIGALGNDTLDGGDGDDSLSGGDGDDSLLGGGGRDILIGGAGTDVLDGGAGNDICGDGEVEGGCEATPDVFADGFESGDVIAWGD